MALIAPRVPLASLLLALPIATWGACLMSGGEGGEALELTTSRYALDGPPTPDGTPTPDAAPLACIGYEELATGHLNPGHLGSLVSIIQVNSPLISSIATWQWAFVMAAPGATLSNPATIPDPLAWITVGSTEPPANVFLGIQMESTADVEGLLVFDRAPEPAGLCTLYRTDVPIPSAAHWQGPSLQPTALAATWTPATVLHQYYEYKRYKVTPNPPWAPLYTLIASKTIYDKFSTSYLDQGPFEPDARYNVSVCPRIWYGVNRNANACAYATITYPPKIVVIDDNPAPIDHDVH